MDEILNSLKEELKELLKDDEIIVDDITYENKGKYYFLTVVLDKVGGIDLDTIVDATKKINPICDKLPIKESYILDVISKERG